VNMKGRKEITAGTKEWADYNVNCAKGCLNNCRYCYAKNMAKRFGRATERTWKNMEVRQSAVAKTYHRVSGRVMFPSSHDIIDTPDVEFACFRVLTKLLESENEVLVTTKPRLSVVQKMVRQFSSYRNKLQFRFTITSRNDPLLKFWEPNAPLFKERMACLQMAFAKEYKTSVSIEPFLDHDPETLVELVAPYSTESIWIGIMNYIPRRGIPRSHTTFYEAARRNCERQHLMKIYENLKDFPKIRFKDSIRFRLNL